MAKVKKLLIALFFMFVCLGSSTVFAAEKTYILSYSPGSLFHQLIRDRTKAVYEKAGLKAEFIPIPHNRSLMNANQGLTDGDVGRVPSIEEKYLNLVRVDEKMMDLKGAVYTLNPNIIHYDDSLLDRYRVGYVLGVRWPEKKMAGRQATTSHDYNALFEMLLQGRVDIVLATEASARSILYRMGERAQKIRKLQPFVFTAPIYHYLHVKNKNIVPLLEKAAVELKNEKSLTFYTGVKTPIFEILEARLKEACRRIGWQGSVHRFGSSQRALVYANESGDGDALRVPNIKQIVPDITDNLIKVPEFILATKFIAYSSSAEFTVDGYDSFRYYHKGIRSGMKILEENLTGPLTVRPESMQLFRMLAEKRLDVVIEHEDIAKFILKKNNLTEIKALSPPLLEFLGYTYIHKKHEALIPELSASLAAMKIDGSFDKIKSETIQRLLAD